MLITSPQLPPKSGYVEVEIDGNRQYQKVETEQDKQLAALLEQNTALQLQLNLMDGAFMDILINVVPTLGTGV